MLLQVLHAKNVVQRNCRATSKYVVGLHESALFPAETVTVRSTSIYMQGFDSKRKKQSYANDDRQRQLGVKAPATRGLEAAKIGQFDAANVQSLLFIGW